MKKMIKNNPTIIRLELKAHINNEKAVKAMTTINVFSSSYLAASFGLIKKLTKMAQMGAILKTSPFY